MLTDNSNYPQLKYLNDFIIRKDPKEDYKILKKIGSGSYGDVYKALNRQSSEYAAVKIVKAEVNDNLKTIAFEINTLRDCIHVNIVKYFGSYFRKNKLWICMEFCGGFSMQNVYTNLCHSLEENCIAFVTRDTLRGLSYMHSKGKIHRDIKGANVLLAIDGQVKIADFGVAAQISLTIQKRKSFIGTPYWMAPEVAAVERKGGYDERCDIWSVGITAIEYAELQPPMFELHPMKALNILSMRNYKPPVLKRKQKWSINFHSFLRVALVVNEKKRPNADSILQHEFLCNKCLNNSLTKSLLNRKKDPSFVPPVVNDEDEEQFKSDRKPLHRIHSKKQVNKPRSLENKRIQIKEDVNDDYTETLKNNNFDTTDCDEQINVINQNKVPGFVPPVPNNEDEGNSKSDPKQHHGIKTKDQAKKLNCIENIRLQRSEDNEDESMDSVKNNIPDIADHGEHKKKKPLVSSTSIRNENAESFSAYNYNSLNDKISEEDSESSEDEAPTLLPRRSPRPPSLPPRPSQKINNQEQKLQRKSIVLKKDLKPIPDKSNVIDDLPIQSFQNTKITPEYITGSYFSLIFEGCPLQINVTVTWTHPLRNVEFIIFGTNEGIYFLNLDEKDECTLTMLFPRKCLWLYIVKNTMISMSGEQRFLYNHNLLLLFKSALNDSQNNSQIVSRHTKMLHKMSFQTAAITDTRNCQIASVARHPLMGVNYLCVALIKQILIMEWFEPMNIFKEMKRISIDNLPDNLTIFSPLIFEEKSFPAMCLGVYSEDGDKNFLFHVLDLNETNDEDETCVLSCPPNNEFLPVIKVIQIDFKTMLIAFQKSVVFTDLYGYIQNSKKQAAELRFEFDIQSIVCLSDSVLAFHQHGLVSMSFKGQLTQEINDSWNIYRLIGCDKNIVVEKRSISENENDSNIYILITPADFS